MGNRSNITYNTFPRQNEDLGSFLTILFNETKFLQAKVVRSDAEEPLRRILKLPNGTYISENEKNNFLFPEQSSYRGKRTKVMFQYDSQNMLEGIIVREDIEQPYDGFIHLDDGRVVSMTECQYSPISSITKKAPTQTKNPYIEMVFARLKKQNRSERAKELHGIYKQCIESRKGRTTNGAYNWIISQLQEPIQGFCVEEFLREVIEKITISQFIEYLANEMQKYDHLQSQANRLKEVYDLKMKVSVKPISMDQTIH